MVSVISEKHRHISEEKLIAYLQVITSLVLIMSQLSDIFSTVIRHPFYSYHLTL